MEGLVDVEMTGGMLEQLLAALDEFSYRSRRDRCIVVLVPCVRCGRQFEELLVRAKARLLANKIDFLCLGCDE